MKYEIDTNKMFAIFRKLIEIEDTILLVLKGAYKTDTMTLIVRNINSPSKIQRHLICLDIPISSGTFAK